MNEKRKRQNWIGGLAEDNPLTAGATLLTSAGLAAITGGVVSTEHMAIILDPDGIDGAPEIAYVTTLTAGAGATGATGLARGKEGTTGREHKRDTPWIHGPTLLDLPITRTTVGPDGATKTGAGYGALSTPWTVIVPVAAGQVVDLEVLAALTCTGDASMFLAILRGATTIYENTHYAPAPNSRASVYTHVWRDDTPGGTGGGSDITYEVYIGMSTAGNTITLRNGATLDTTAELLQGKSLFRATARFPT